MIDIHCHLLPGIDDGPPTLEAALALAQGLVADGIRHVVCTPHVFPGRFENRRSSIEDVFDDFAAVLRGAGLPLGLSWAGEVRLTPEILELLPRNELPWLGEVDGFKTMLLEMPDGQVPLGADRLVAHLLSQRIRPVLVHPERNRGVMERPERLRPFVNMGCYVQLTAGSLVGQFGAKAQACAEVLLDEGWAHVVASDAHNMGGRRPRMADAAAWLREHHGSTLARQLTVDGPALICGLDAEACSGAAPLSATTAA